MGLVASALLLGKHPWNWLLSLVCLGGFLLLIRHGEKLRVAVHLHLLWLVPTAGLLVSFLVGMLRLFADDGGWYESGGTLSLWWDAPGREDALAMGFPPALGASLGALFGGNFVVSTDPDLQVMVADPNSGASDSIPADSAFPEVQVAGEPDTPMPETVAFPQPDGPVQGPEPPPQIPPVKDYNVDGWQWVMENDSWVLYQATPDGTTYGAGIPQSVFEADPESAACVARVGTRNAARGAARSFSGNRRRGSLSGIDQLEHCARQLSAQR